MSGIEIGSVWREKTDGTERHVVIVEDEVVWVKRHGMKGRVWIGKPNFLARFEPVPDMVNHPPHYKDASGIECIEVTRKMQFCGGNCFKYLYRAGQKGSPIEDLEKARWYANRAGEMGESYDDNNWAKNIREVARYRDGNISKAMIQIRHGKWSSAALVIKDEIARLESE